MDGIVKIAGCMVLIYAVYCGILFVMQRQVIFPRYLIPVPAASGAQVPGVEKIWIDVSFGKVEAWYVPADSSHGDSLMPAVIFSHGNAELIDDCLDEIRRFTRFGMHVLMVEYPGYGRSAGRPSQKAITEVFVTAYDDLVNQKNVDPDRIVLFGRSLGGGAACALAEKRPCAALILLATFTSVRSFASTYLVPGSMIRDPFDNLAVVSAYPGPVLVLHGKNDTVIPYRHGVSLYEASRNGKLISYLCGHNDCPPSWDAFFEDVEVFLKESGVLIHR